MGALTVRQRGTFPFTVGWILPRVVVFLCAIDLAARFLPLAPLCFRAWECLTRYPAPGSIFQANARFQSEQAYGNLASIANLKQFRQYRPQVFTTDAWGFRNSGPRPGAASAVLVVGDSFAVGDGLSDGETLSATLAAETGLGFYNAGGPYDYLRTVRHLKAKLGLAGGRVLVVHPETLPVAFLTEARDRRPDWVSAVLARAFGGEAERYRSLLRGWWHVSPLKIVAEKAYRSLCDGEILPNPFARNVVPQRLRNGATMLFYAEELKGAHTVLAVDAFADFYAALARDLLAEGFAMSVVLVPSKYSVYQPLLERSEPKPWEGPRYLARLAVALEQRGIATVDLTSTFLCQAAKDLREGKYLYWLDDTHWNGAGVSLAARVIRRELFATPDPTGHMQEE